MTASIHAVAASPDHSFSKPAHQQIELLAGLGVRGDAHCGETVKHRSRVKRDPTAPNLRQVHLVHLELIEELQAAGFNVQPGTLGENITTRGLDLLNLPTGTQLHIGQQAVIEVTGLRNPCHQLDDYQQGLLAAVLERDSEGNVVRKSGVMAIVHDGGLVQPGDAIDVRLPEQHEPLQPV